jgi:hypothetical protein
VAAPVAAPAEDVFADRREAQGAGTGGGSPRGTGSADPGAA